MNGDDATYQPTPYDTSDIQLPELLLGLTELLAENSHENWAQERIRNGWRYGEVRNDELKTHPSLVPYPQLSDEEKEYDRRTSMNTLRMIIKLGWKITPPSN